MFYCKNCSDSLDITKNTALAQQENIKILNKPEELIKIVLQEIDPKKKKTINDYQLSINFSESLLKSHIETLEDINFTNLETSFGEFKNLILIKFKEIIKQQKNTVQFFFSCTNCATTYVLEPGLVLYSINLDKSELNIEEDPAIKCTDPTLPRTKDFMCPNNKCINNTKKTATEVLTNKEAVFYRNNKTYNLKYICCQCNTQWGT